MVDDSSEKLPAFPRYLLWGGRGEAEEQRGAEQHLGRGPVPGTSVWYSLRSVAKPPPPPFAVSALCCCCSTVSADGSLGRQINAVICRRSSPAARSAEGGLPGQSCGGEAVKTRSPLLFPAGWLKLHGAAAHSRIAALFALLRSVFSVSGRAVQILQFHFRYDADIWALNINQYQHQSHISTVIHTFITNFVVWSVRKVKSFFWPISDFWTTLVSGLKSFACTLSLRKTCRPIWRQSGPAFLIWQEHQPQGVINISYQNSTWQRRCYGWQFW